jgi:hypothetical protein
MISKRSHARHTSTTIRTKIILSANGCSWIPQPRYSRRPGRTGAGYRAPGPECSPGRTIRAPRLPVRPGECSGSRGSGGGVSPQHQRRSAPVPGIRRLILILLWRRSGPDDGRRGCPEACPLACPVAGPTLPTLSAATSERTRPRPAAAVQVPVRHILLDVGNVRGQGPVSDTYASLAPRPRGRAGTGLQAARPARPPRGRGLDPRQPNSATRRPASSSWRSRSSSASSAARRNFGLRATSGCGAGAGNSQLAARRGPGARRRVFRQRSATLGNATSARRDRPGEAARPPRPTSAALGAALEDVEKVLIRPLVRERF